MTTSTIIIHKIEDKINKDFFNNLYNYFKNLENNLICNNLTKDKRCIIKKIEIDTLSYDRNQEEIFYNFDEKNKKYEINLIRIIVDYGKNCDNLQRIHNIENPDEETTLTIQDYLLRYFYISIILFQNNLYMIYQILNNESCVYVIENEIKKLYKKEINKEAKIKKISIPLKIDSIFNLSIESYILPKDIAGSIKKEKGLTLKNIFTFYKKNNRGPLQKYEIIDNDIVNSINNGESINKKIIDKINTIYGKDLMDYSTKNDIFIEVKINNKSKKIQITDDFLPFYSRIQTEKILENNFSNIKEVEKDILENFKDIVIKFVILD